MNREIQLTSHERRATSNKCVGSALILAVVLTSLLAIVGVVFVLLARVDKISTSAISENKELNLAVDTVIADISRELVLDVPGIAGRAYYNYPDANNPWLACLEPYESGGNYYWHQISDVNEGTGWHLQHRSFATQNVGVAPIGLSTSDVVREYPEFRVDSAGNFLDKNGNVLTDGISADADGDGIADSKWIQLDSTSNKGKPIYAAIRIVDNGGMLNVNTGYKFDPGSLTQTDIDGSSQTQINLEKIARTGDTIAEIDAARNPAVKPLSDYRKDVVWPIKNSYSPYLPFDISDELDLRYRYCITSKALMRLENVWNYTIGIDFSNKKDEPYAGGTFGKLKDWCTAVTDPCDPNNYRQHYLTTYNMDRIIAPDGNKMPNINNINPAVLADVDRLYKAVKAGLRDGGVSEIDSRSMAAQIAVNLIDYRDSDSDVNVFKNPDDSNTYYGFETPCIYLSEFACDINGLVSPSKMSYAVELYKPDADDKDPVGWRLVIDGDPCQINWQGNKQFYVMRWQDMNAPLGVNGADVCIDEQHTTGFKPVFTGGIVIKLQRPVKLPDGTNHYITVDSNVVPNPNNTTGWLTPDEKQHSIERGISLHKCIRRLWNPIAITPTTLGSINSYIDASPGLIQAHPANQAFTNVGEIGMVFIKDANAIGPGDTEATVRLNLADTRFQQVFKYLTVFDPNINTNEMRIKGRININTAPWYVIAQLPWVSQRANQAADPCLARSIVAYRDKTGAYSARAGSPGFKTIGELMDVNFISPTDPNSSICAYANDNKDLLGFPDLTTLPTGGDGAADDFEERDVIFARISNLVTVRSDVFTAYILVRIGTDGPQKRVIAILDRSDVTPKGGKVKIIALYPVSDPR